MLINSADKCEECSIGYKISNGKKSCEAKVSGC